MLTMTGEPIGSTVELNWLPPLHPNGAIHYEIEYVPAMIPGDPVNARSSSSPYFTLTLPNEFLTYNVRVAAVSTQGRAQSNVLSVCPGMNRMRGIFKKIPFLDFIKINDCRHVKATPCHLLQDQSFQLVCQSL